MQLRVERTEKKKHMHKSIYNKKQFCYTQNSERDYNIYL